MIAESEGLSLNLWGFSVFRVNRKLWGSGGDVTAA